MHATFQHDERALFTRLRDNPSPALRDAALRRYLPLAHKLAARYRHAGEPIEDLEQVAAIGLLKAIDRFDPRRGNAFTSYAVPTILGEVRRHFRDHTWAMRVPRALQEMTLRIERARDDLSASRGRQPTVAELAERLEVGEELILQALELALARQPLPADELGAEDTAPLPGRVDDGYARVDDRALLARLLTRLSACEAQVVFLRFHADLTREDIAHRVGVSQIHVSRLLHHGLMLLSRNDPT